ncbi:MAG: hypothetical protein IJR49_06335, partial [Treponema sp.]|nr:hypothetical protein [Treponema sp.]
FVIFVFASCSKNNADSSLTEVQRVIKSAQGMSLKDLARKAIEESNGKTFYAAGNSSRGKTALPLFIEYLRSIDPTYKLDFEWDTFSGEKIFSPLEEDAKNSKARYSLTLIQDGNKIESRMVKTGFLRTFIPKEWAEVNGLKPEAFAGYLALQTLNKVFMFNNRGSKKFSNVWDFVSPGEHGLFMDIDLEVVGKNFLYMLTRGDYARTLREAFDNLDDAKKSYFNPIITSLVKDEAELGLGENGRYALAWIKLFVESYRALEDDGPICNMLVNRNSHDQFGLLVYSKLRSVEESANVSRENVTVAAYQDDWSGIGGYGYCHYLFVNHNSPLPWTACALIAYMTCTTTGFSAWGRDMGGYSSNSVVAKGTDIMYNHSVREGDRGYEWWVREGNLVLEDPEYCFTMSSVLDPWISKLVKFKG